MLTFLNGGILNTLGEYRLGFQTSQSQLNRFARVRLGICLFREIGVSRPHDTLVGTEIHLKGGENDVLTAQYHINFSVHHQEELVFITL